MPSAAADPPPDVRVPNHGGASTQEGLLREGGTLTHHVLQSPSGWFPYVLLSLAVSHLLLL